MTLDEAIVFLDGLEDPTEMRDAVLAIARAVKALQPCKHPRATMEWFDGGGAVRCPDCGKVRYS